MLGAVDLTHTAIFTVAFLRALSVVAYYGGVWGLVGVGGELLDFAFWFLPGCRCSETYLLIGCRKVENHCAKLTFKGALHIAESI